MLNEEVANNPSVKFAGNDDHSEFIKRIEDAYKLYKQSEVFLNNVFEDYGKLKIARLRMEFARHELNVLLDEAKSKGIKLDSSSIPKDVYCQNSQ